LYAGEACELESSFVGFLAFVDVVLAVAEHSINPLGDLASNGKERDLALLAAGAPMRYHGLSFTPERSAAKRRGCN
jgi:hypothetical protein